jgi:hypothetical protein
MEDTMGNKPNDLDLSTIEIWKRWLEGAEHNDGGFYVPTLRDDPTRVTMPDWRLIRTTDNPNGLAIYKNDAGDLFAVGNKNGAYAVRVQTG